MSITSRQISLLRVAVRQLGWSDDAYRAALVRIAGVTSATELDREGFEAMLGFCESRGFTPLEPRGPSFGERAGMASFAQLELIRNLWAEITRHAYPGEEELNRWLLKHSKVSSLRFLTKPQAQKVITALKAWKARPKAKPESVAKAS
jgi:hypothetical protein